MAARDEAGRAWTGVPQGQSADEESADEKMGPALPASHGPRTWDGGQVPCEGRPDTRWSGQAPSREPRGRSRFRPADCVRTEEITLDTVNPMQGGLRARLLAAPKAAGPPKSWRSPTRSATLCALCSCQGSGSTRL